MELFSQHKLKIAATEPEHLVRKAELDLLDVRVEVIEKTFDVRPALTGGVLGGNSERESFRWNDAASVPQPTFLTESTTVADDTEPFTASPLSADGDGELMGVRDDVRSSQPVDMPENWSIREEVLHETARSMIPDISHDILSLSDATTITTTTEKQMDNLKIQGEIEVLLEDRDGNLKSREIVTNTITDTFERYILYDMLNGGTLSSLLRSNTRTGFNFLSRTLPATFGIYALDRDIDLKKDTYLPPYVRDDQVSLDQSVSFYNVGGGQTESSQEMTPVDPRCYFDKTKKEFAFEYVKNTGFAEVKSVCIGRAHTLKNGIISVALAEASVMPSWSSGNANYLLEHKTDTTHLWKTNGTISWRHNLKTRFTEDISATQCVNAITGANTLGGLVAGNVVFKATKHSASGSSYTVRISYIDRFTASTTVGTKDVTFTCRTGMSVNTAVTPVMVMRPDLGKLEIFVTTSVGDHDGVIGCNIQKATLGNLDTPASLSVTVEDLGVIPYAISSWTAVTAGYHLNGFYHDGKYYLPCYGVIGEQGTLLVTADAAYQTGIIVSSDLETVEKTVNFRSATGNEVNAFVLSDGGVAQCRVNSATIAYVHLSQVVSGSNLPAPVTKLPEDVLRIIYRYKLL